MKFGMIYVIIKDIKKYDIEEKIMLKTGNKAPVFTLDQDNGETLSLQDCQGKNIVLFFYPKDNTPGCTMEAKDFTQLKSEFEANNTVIYGVSKDSIKSHQNFCVKQDLTIRLLSDPDGQVMDEYGVWKEKSMYGKTFMGVIRSTFLIDANGVIQEIWEKVKVKGHAQSVLDSVKSLAK